MKTGLPNALAVILLLHLAGLATARQPGKSLSPAQGPFKVGFKKYSKEDLTRSYKHLYNWDNTIYARPISISLWYPGSNVSADSKLNVREYLAILKQEEEWESLPDDRILGWFYTDNEKNRKHLETGTGAYRNAQPVTGKFPVVIYAPGYQASSIENFALCEFLASHGYIVLSCPSLGTESRPLEGGTARDIETQARDIEFLMGEAMALTNVDPDRISVIGYSFGGLSNVLAQMRNERIKALVCLDGSIKYQFKKLPAWNQANAAKKVDVPFMFMSQKDIPLKVMIEDRIDTTLNRNFAFFDSLKYSPAYSLKFNDLTHPGFTSMGILFQDRDPRQDKSDREIKGSYKWVCAYTLHFLNAFLKDDKSSIQFLNNDPISNGVAPGVISHTVKKPVAQAMSFEEFHALAKNQGYKELEALVKQLKDRTEVNLQEWKLNNLGLHLLFQNKVQEGIHVLSLNIILYPNSANAFDSLAEGYLVQGNKELAMTNFRLSLKLDPQNQNAIDRLKELSKK